MRHASVIGALLFLALSGSAVAHAQAASTEIRETLRLTNQACTIAITTPNVLICDGQSVTVSATLECGPGYERVQDPQWFLDGQFVGSGDQIVLTPSPGNYQLAALCGACQDTITVTVQDAVSCPETPRLSALFAQDSSEATIGIFMQVNAIPVTAQNFGQTRLRMRPLTLSADPLLGSGQFVLDASGTALEVYRPDGTLLTLPAMIDVTSLPDTFLVNARALGEALVTATYQPGTSRSIQQAGVDEVRIRVGSFPGLAGRALSGYPHFEFVTAVNDVDVLEGAIDPHRHAERLGLPYRAYVVEHRTPAQWAADDQLVDVSGGFELATLDGSSITANTLALWSSGVDGGAAVGKPYDVVYDFGLDGRLDPGDLIDGLDDAEAGVYIVRDLGLPGPHAITTIDYYGGPWMGQRTYFPAAIATMGQLPLVVISHGNVHNYQWYDYLGEHLASYGYVVMSHMNNTVPGIDAASTTTLSNTDYLIGYQDEIEDGVLDGHIDAQRITWIGHSRGGEGVVRAYDRLYDGDYVPQHYATDDIVLISSIAPTVYLGTVDSNPHEVDYHLLYGAADGDVNGGCHLGSRQSLRIAEAARGNVQVTYIHGAGHNDFNCCGWGDATGPDLIGRAEAQRVAKSYYVALIEHYVGGNVAARDFLTRSYGALHPSGIDSQVLCANSFREALDTERFVIDDFQTNTSLGTSSSGGAVTYTVSNAYENRLDDGDLEFEWNASDPANGMTRTDDGDLYQGGVVFDWTTGENPYYELEVIAAQRDFRDHAFLSFRACQASRHPETVALDGPLTFTVTLRDGQGVTSSIQTGLYGAITRPYQRTGLGSGDGWANEFNTIRMRLSDFEADGSGIDLGDVAAVRFEFGQNFGSARGRVGIDDVELARQ